MLEMLDKTDDILNLKSNLKPLNIRNVAVKQDAAQERRMDQERKRLQRLQNEELKNLSIQKKQNETKMKQKAKILLLQEERNKKLQAVISLREKEEDLVNFIING
jgi:hypothetical protein